VPQDIAFYPACYVFQALSLDRYMPRRDTSVDWGKTSVCGNRTKADAVILSSEYDIAWPQYSK